MGSVSGGVIGVLVGLVGAVVLGELNVLELHVHGVAGDLHPSLHAELESGGVGGVVHGASRHSGLGGVGVLLTILKEQLGLGAG